MSFPEEATHPRCCGEGYPDEPGRASNKEGEPWTAGARECRSLRRRTEYHRSAKIHRPHCSTLTKGGKSKSSTGWSHQLEQLAADVLGSPPAPADAIDYLAGSGGSRTGATIFIEQEKRSHMMVSCVIEPSLQRVRRISSCGAHKSPDVIHGRRIGTSSLCKGTFLQAPPMQEPR
jgi:hypothetical protein